MLILQASKTILFHIFLTGKSNKPYLFLQTVHPAHSKLVAAAEGTVLIEMS